MAEPNYNALSPLNILAIVFSDIIIVSSQPFELGFLLGNACFSSWECKMTEDKFDNDHCLKEDEWFSDVSDEHYWMSGIDAQPVDRRDECREHVNIDVKINPGGRLCKINDISIGGVLIFTEQPLVTGQLIKMNLFTDYGTHMAFGVVRWQAKGKESSLNVEKTGMGVQFLWVSLGMKELLTHALYHPSPRSGVSL